MKIRFLVRRSLLALLMLALLLPAASLQAARHKVDCRQVMAALDQGQKPKAVAKTMGISTSSVYRCRRLSRAASKPAPPPPVAR